MSEIYHGQKHITVVRNGPNKLHVSEKKLDLFPVQLNPDILTTFPCHLMSCATESM